MGSEHRSLIVKLSVTLVFLSLVFLLILGAVTPGRRFNLDSTVAAGKDLLFRGKALVGNGTTTALGGGGQEGEDQKRPKKGLWTPSKRKVDLSEYKLTRELVAKYAKNNFITVSFGNLHYIGFIENWVKHLNELGVDNYIVGAMDDDALTGLVDRGINAFSMSHSFPRNDFGWGSKTFYKMARRKIKLIQEFLLMDYDVMVSDVDTVWLQNPNVFFDKHPDMDIMTSSDSLQTSSPDGELLEDAATRMEAYNIGILYFRSTNATKEFLAEWVSMIEKDENYWDQNAFNDLLRKDLNVVRPGGRAFKSYHDRVTVGVLPVSSFCNGHTFFVQSMPQSLNIKPNVVHATFQYAGTEGKRHRFRERQLWYDEPEYYSPDKGVLVYDTDVPAELLENAAFTGFKLDLPATRGHFDLVNHQLKQLRNAIGVAKALGRTLVLPKLLCGNDRWWAPHDGTIPGSKFERPFVCPLDHIIDVNIMLDVKYVDFREYSFMENRRTPQALKDSQLLVQVCSTGSEGEEDANCEVTDNNSAAVVKIPSGLDDKELIEKLGSFSKSHKVLRFTSMLDTFKGFRKREDTDKFHKVIASFMGLWCCVRAPVGHVWYDILWDVVPHVDRQNRKWEEKWDMKLGP